MGEEAGICRRDRGIYGGVNFCRLSGGGRMMIEHGIVKVPCGFCCGTRGPSDGE